MENEKLSKENLEDHVELFQELLFKARELEEMLPPTGSPAETLALVFVLIGRLLSSAYKEEVPVDVRWLVEMHMDNCEKAFERHRVKKEAGLPTEPSMN